MAFKKGLKGEYGFAKFFMNEEREYLTGEYPNLKKKVRDRAEKDLQIFYGRFMSFLWRHLKQGTEPENIIINQEIIAKIAKKQVSKKFSAKYYLENFKKNILPDFEYSNDYRYTEHKARNVINIGFSDHDAYVANQIQAKYAMMTKEQLKARIEDTGLVYADSGEKFTKRKSSKDSKASMRSLLAAAEKRKIKQELNKAQEKLTLKVIEYHHQDCMIAIHQGLVKKNKAELAKVYKELQAANKHKPEDNQDELFKDEALFLQLVAEPTPLYTIAKKTSRVAPATYPHWINVPKKLRNAQFKGLCGIDLTSIQFAGLAPVLNLSEIEYKLKELKEQGLKLWDHLIAELPDTGLPFETTKGTIKTAVYSLVFGAGPTAMRAPFEELFPTKEKVDAVFQAFLNIPLIATVKTVRDSWLEDRAKLYFDDFSYFTRSEYSTYLINSNRDEKSTKPLSFMQWRMSQARAESRSDLACDSQQLEQEIMSSIYDLAIQEQKKSRSRFTICLNIFDGLVLKLSDNTSKLRNSITNKIRDMVKEQLWLIYEDRQDVTCSLVVTDIDVDIIQ